MRWYLNPFTIRDAVADARRVADGGGPRGVHLRGIGRPEGCFLPSSTISLEVVARNGARTSFEPELPVPLPVAYGYRIARRLGVPVLAEIDPQQLKLGLGRRPAGGFRD